MSFRRFLIQNSKHVTSFLEALVKAKFLLKRAQKLIEAGLENVILITVFCLDLLQVDLVLLFRNARKTY